MRGAVSWTLGTLALAAAVHVGALLALPYAIMGVVMDRAQGLGGVNTIMHGPRATADARQFVLPSPDLAYSACVFDVSERPLRIRSPVPDGYMSVSLYASNTDNFFVVNDRQSDGVELEIILAGSGTATLEPGRAWVVRAPSDTGIVFFRWLIPSDQAFERIDAKRRLASCAPA